MARTRIACFCCFFVVLCLREVSSKAGLCEVESGQSNIILDIEESRGDAIDQKTVPEELPVSGDPYNETTLELIFPGRQPRFKLNGKKLQLLEPLDRDNENLSHVVFQLSCSVKQTNKKRTIPVIVRVSDINDNKPKFINTPYETTVPELTPVGSTIFKNVVAVDADAGVNGIVEYSIAPGDGTRIGNNEGVGRNRITTADGYGYFSINLPHQGQVTVNRTLDFEKTQRYLVTILASDRARNISERFTSTTTLTVNIRDDDDQDPSFIYQGCMLSDGACINPEYSASVSSGVLSGILNISPEKIQAVDMDSINAPIYYTFLSGNPSNYREFFEINPNTGAVKQIKAVDTTVTKKFDINIKAVEVSEAKRSATAKLTITVKPVDSNPPIITASNVEGFVDENAPIGTKVIDKNGDPIVLTVSDADLGPEDPKPAYTFELTTNFFAIDPTGVLIINEENLDRDPPSPGRFRFQVVAREKTGVAASAPLSFVVTLNDVNDNAPMLPMIAPITVQAGETKRVVTKVEATDNDEGENAEITYSIYHVSNNGLHKFKIDPKTGVIESVRKLNAGEQFSITVQATDKGGKYSQTIVEVNVIPGPNTRSPVFQQPVYEVQVSEGASINSTVATITAVDPENDPVSYSIVSGNDLRQFAIGDKSGVITVIRKLDREDLTRYQLLIKAEDSGGLSSTATVNIKVTDINDKNPEFVDLPYEFTVKEGEARKLIGRVHAEDADEGINAEITYFAPDDIPFTVDPETGDVLTKIVLDYEQNDEYKFVVTARDGAPDYRLATATVTVKVIDVEDEVPVFHQSSYEARVKENVPDYTVLQVTADDPDTKKQITYMIKQGDTELFSIDPKTGVIKTIRGLDYERENQHILIIGTVENTSDLPGSTTKVVVNVQVKIQVLDVNDNKPEFIFPESNQKLSRGRYFAAIPRAAQFTSTVIQIKAHDKDNGKYGKLEYKILGGRGSDYFAMDGFSGIIRTTATFDNVDPAELPFKFDVRVRDNPNSTDNFNSIVAPVIVNLIGEENLMILVVQDASPDVLQKEAPKIASIIEEKSDLLIGIDRVAVRKNLTKNGTVEMYPQDSDVWFYAVDPDTEAILDRNSSRIQRSIIEKPAMSNITFDVSTLVRANAIDIHAPVMPAEPVRTQTAIAFSGEVFPYALIIIACVILILGIAGIIYICVSWSRYKAYKERMQRMYVVPRYDPVYVEPNLKEYETQVLQMSVPVDDNDSYNDLQLDFSNKNHAFSLDNVSYITKENGESTGQQSPVSSEAATTARASSIAGTHGDANIHSLRRSTLGRKNHNNSNANTMNNHDATPVLNPLYNHGNDLLNPSPSNDNVTFRERKDYSHLGFTYLGEQSPVETTTEL
ncbi:cadherin 99C isoform X3 [Osmia lignaria lignaria]|uniref:cadherin 99C isoform X3 n=1 Tax=Osmia lignaria lignaria TaxID=1437193 RepID=UPI00402BDA18